MGQVVVDKMDAVFRFAEGPPIVQFAPPMVRIFEEADQRPFPTLPRPGPLAGQEELDIMPVRGRGPRPGDCHVVHVRGGHAREVQRRPDCLYGEQRRPVSCD